MKGFFEVQKEQNFNGWVHDKNLGKILRIQMLIYPNLPTPPPSHLFPLTGKGFLPTKSLEILSLIMY